LTQKAIYAIFIARKFVLFHHFFQRFITTYKKGGEEWAAGAGFPEREDIGPSLGRKGGELRVLSEEVDEG
jgi:hypothetical protein